MKKYYLLMLKQSEQYFVANAPILITVYDRLWHFSKTIESLAANPLASKTILYVAIDAPSRECDIEKNKMVVEYAKKIAGFKYVEIIIRESNIGAYENSILASNYVLGMHGKMIFTEDDNIFSSHFLEYMNSGLVKYEKNEKIFSICAYLEPINNDMRFDTFIRPGFTSYGYGIWKSRFDRIDFTADDFFETYRNPLKYFDFANKFGYHIPAGLIYSKIKNKIFGDYSICHQMFKDECISIFPKKTLVRNIGQDGSGLNSGVDSILQNQEIWYPTHSIEHQFDAFESDLTNEELKKYHKKPFYYNLIRYFQYMLHAKWT